MFFSSNKADDAWNLRPSNRKKKDRHCQGLLSRKVANNEGAITLGMTHESSYPSYSVHLRSLQCYMNIYEPGTPLSNNISRQNILDRFSHELKSRRMRAKLSGPLLWPEGLESQGRHHGTSTETWSFLVISHNKYYQCFLVMVLFHV